MKRFEEYPFAYCLGKDNYHFVGERRALLVYWSKELIARREGFYFWICSRVSGAIEKCIRDVRIKYEKT